MKHGREKETFLTSLLTGGTGLGAKRILRVYGGAQEEHSNAGKKGIHCNNKRRTRIEDFKYINLQPSKLE